MKKIKSNYINVAFNRSVEKEEATMDDIVGYFTGQIKRGYGDKEPTFRKDAEAII